MAGMTGRRRPGGGGLTGRRSASWATLGIGTLYFLLPLVATFLFSLRGKKGVLGFSAYARVFADPQFLRTFLFSLEMSVLTIAAGLLLLVPTILWAHLRVPRALPVIEVFALLPFVIPPIVLVFGLIRSYSRPPLPLVNSPALLVAGYVVLCFPYIFRTIDTGLRSMNLRALTEASRSLGAGWGGTLARVVLPNLRVSLLNAAFITLSIVMGELTLAVLLNWPAFGAYITLMGRSYAYEPAALSIISFLLTWGAIGIMQAASRGPGALEAAAGGTH